MITAAAAIMVVVSGRFLTADVRSGKAPASRRP
jgi:hypothetical protein